MSGDTPALSAALAAWRRHLGEAGVLSGAAAQQHYGKGTTGAERTIPAALRPRSVADVRAIVAIAGDYSIPLYPISTGNNWGYGSASPARDGCVVLDLSGLDRIVEMDAQSGLATVEPGVTQQQLGDYLESRGLPFLVPVTGAGPRCSLVGNALERGYGITPYADHFAAVTALEAVLPDGRLYRSALSELGGTAADRAYKWGVGPYLDGLFTQSGLGVVTQMTIALAPRPERVEAFLFAVDHDTALEAAVTAVQRALRALGGVSGSVNLMNARRILAMAAPYPGDRASPHGVLPPAVVAELAAHYRVPPWTGFGALYGNAGIVKAARRAVRKILRQAVARLRFVTPGGAAAIDRWCNRIPALREGRLARRARTLAAAMQLVAGKPSEAALPLAYWRTGVGLRPEGAVLDPAADGCGLIWYSPLVPMAAPRVTRYVAMVDEICVRHGIEPLITLTSLSDRCFDSSVPLLFDLHDAEARRRAHACYMALLEAGRDEGFLPYRVGLQAMDWLVRPGLPCWDLVAALKSAVDPRGIIAPGRYGP
ncbi:MAG TPA: FAD-binding oxidoreductase [Stellaceae bacterium]|jgi:4-cresol dehydrogenase (hydroxylating)|nr:FAD-binding oxidoreductase [Stellaceae bacterium]